MSSSCALAASFLVLVLLLSFKHVFMRLDRVQNLIGFPLGPNKVVILPVIIITHTPPESRFESSSNNTRVIASPDIILIWCKTRIWPGHLLHAIALEDLDEELTVVLLLQFEISFLILWISQILTQLLDFLTQVVQAVDVLRLLGFGLLDLLLHFDRLPIWSKLLPLSIRLVCLCCSCGVLLGLLGVMVLLEVLLGHLPLDNHKTCVYERLFEELRLEHAN